MGTGPGSLSLRKGLVVFQFTISIILIIGTLVVNNQLNFMKNKKLGYNKEQILTVLMRGGFRENYSTIKNDPAITTICDNQDISGEKKIGIIKKDQPIFAFEKIFTPGDVVAMLIGESERDLLQLKDKVKIDLEHLPELTDPQRALNSNAPLIHPEIGSNLIIHYPLRKGNIERGFAESDFIIEQSYTTPLIEHAYIEPEAVIAFPNKSRKEIKIIGSIQNPFTARKIVASVLGWQLARVRVEQAELGGAFGGKDDTMNILAARAAIGAGMDDCGYSGFSPVFSSRGALGSLSGWGTCDGEESQAVADVEIGRGGGGECRRRRRSAVVVGDHGESGRDAGGGPRHAKEPPILADSHYGLRGGGLDPEHGMRRLAGHTHSGGPDPSMGKRAQKEMALTPSVHE